MTGLHQLQTSPAILQSANVFTSANVPEAGNSFGDLDAAAAVLRRHFEELAARIGELQALRDRVLEAEQKLDPRYT